MLNKAINNFFIIPSSLKLLTNHIRIKGYLKHICYSICKENLLHFYESITIIEPISIINVPINFFFISVSWKNLYPNHKLTNVDN